MRPAADRRAELDDEILQDAKAFAPLGELARDAFLADAINQAAAERYLERAIGRMIDVNYHVITELGGAPPKDYFESFVRLSEHGALDGGFARRVAACAGLRNRIAHEYDEIDAAKLHEALRTAAADLPEYIRQVTAFLDRQSPTAGA